MSLTILFNEVIRNLNPDLCKVYDEVEQMHFKTDRELYVYICGRFGSTAFDAIHVFRDGERVPGGGHFGLKI